MPKFSGITIVRRHHKSIGSTFDDVPNCVPELKPDAWYLITADFQTAGQGTHKRTWTSPPDVNIYATFVFQVPIEKMQILANISQVTAYAAIVTLKQFGLEGRLKWVNDVRVGGKKICGILCKSEICGPELSVSAGIGINVNMSSDACASFEQPVTSCLDAAGKLFDKEAILLAFQEHFVTNMKLLMEQGFKPFSKLISELMEFVGETIQVKDDIPKTITEGVMIGLNDEGMLLLKTKDKGTVTFLTGHIITDYEIGMLKKTADSLKSHELEHKIRLITLEYLTGDQELIEQVLTPLCAYEKKERSDKETDLAQSPSNNSGCGKPRKAIS